MRRTPIIVLGLCGGLVFAATALATNQPLLTYDPPTILLRDLPQHNSMEAITVTKDGGDFVLTNSNGGVALDPASESGCENVIGGYACDVAGVERITVKLDANSDSASIDLGSKAEKVKQILTGGGGGDTIDGGPGKQKISGGGGADSLTGGPGPDVINGGPGDDTCDGGPGDDELKRCEGTFPQ